LLKLGFAVAQSSVAKYMVKRPGPPSQRWHTFLRNHAPDIAAMDLFVVPTIGFDLLERHFALPEGVDTDKIEASFKKGVLTVRLPMKPEAIKPEKKIEVKTT